MPEGLDLSEVNRYVLDQASSILGTRKYHTHMRHPWMSDKDVRRLLYLYMEAKDLYDISPSDETRQLMKEVYAAFRVARDRAKDVAHMSLLHKVHDRQVSPYNAISRLTRKQPIHRSNPYLDGEAAVGFWRRIFEGEDSTQNGEPEVDITGMQYCDSITFTIDPDTVTSTLLSMAPSAPGPDKLPLRVLTMFVQTLAPHLATALTSALSHLPDTLKVGETLLFPKTQPPSSDPAEYRPITLLPVLVRLLHKIVDIEMRKLMFGDPNADPVRRHLHSRLFVGQSGFQKDRCANEAATTMHILRSAQRHGGASSNSLFGAFLDIHKAFDSLHHGHLLSMLEHNLHLPREWLEIVRRLLVRNTTTIRGRRLRIRTGFVQGSPLSPSFCLVYLDDLAKDLLAFFREHDLPFPLKGVIRGIEEHWLLLLLLLFADDILVLGLTPGHLQRLLDRIGDWANRRGLRFSAKSVAAVLAGTTGIPSPLPVLRQDVALQWVEGGTCEVYLGVPYKAYKPHGRPEGPFPINASELRGQVGTIHALFTSSTQRRLVYIPTLVTLTEQLIRAKALYPTDVVDIDYDALDTIVYDVIRKVIQLPKCTPKAMLFWELGMLPARLAAYKRALRAMWRYVQYSPFYYHVVSRVMLSKDHRAISRLFTHGPLARLSTILNHELHGGKTMLDVLTPRAKDSADALRAMAKIPRNEWYGRVDTAIATCFERWVQGKLREYPEHYRTYLGRVHSPARQRKGRPAYISLAGDRARVALRFKTPFLRFFHDRSKPVPDCAWCGAPAAEHPLHLLSCQEQPDTVRGLLTAARAAVAGEAGERAVNRAIEQMCWRAQSQETTSELLGAVAHMINEYRKWVPVPEGGEHPITAVRTIAIGGRASEEVEGPTG
jgi:hypothetical protein